MVSAAAATSGCQWAEILSGRNTGFPDGWVFGVGQYALEGFCDEGGAAGDGFVEWHMAMSLEN
jgi:hypothetical protein